MLAAQESLKLRPAGRGVGGVKTSSGKLRLPSQSGLAPDFTQPFSNLKLFTNTKQEPSSQRKQKMSKKKKKDPCSLGGLPKSPARGRSTAAPSQPPGRAPRRGGLERGAPAAPSLPAIAPEPPPPPGPPPPPKRPRRPSPNIRESGATFSCLCPPPTPTRAGIDVPSRKVISPALPSLLPAAIFLLPRRRRLNPWPTPPPPPPRSPG